MILAIKLDAEAGFVHELRRNGGDIGEVQVVVVSLAVIRGFGERGAAGTHVFLMLMPGTEAGDEGILRAELPIDFGHAYPETLRCGDVLEDGGLAACCVDADGVDGSKVVYRAVLEVEDEV